MNVSKSDSGRESFLNSIVLPNLNSKSPNICQREITEKYLVTAPKSMPNDKSPGHNGLTKKFYEHFWEDIFYEFLETA